MHLVLAVQAIRALAARAVPMVLTLVEHTLSDPSLSILHLTVVGASLVKWLVLCVSPRQLRAHHGMCSLNRRQALVNDLVAYFSLIRDSGQFWQGSVPRVADLLPAVDVLNVASVLQVRGWAEVSI